MTNIEIEELKPGSWLMMEFGYHWRVFYILYVLGDNVILGSPNWLVSDATQISKTRLKGAELLGQGKQRWWWRFLPWRDLVCPFTRPAKCFW